MANSSRLVLPTTTAPAAGQPLHHGGVVGRAPALEDPRRAGGGHAPGAEVVLEGHRHPGQRARVARRRPPSASTASAAGAGLVGQHQVEGVDARPRGPRWRRGGPRATLAARALARADRRGRRRCQGGGAATDRSVRSRLLAQDGRHPEAPVLDRGRLRQHLVAVEHGTGARRRAARWPAGRGARSGATSARSRASTSAAWSSIAPELLGELVELVVGQREPGQGGDVGDVVTGEAIGHGAHRRGARGRPRPAPASPDLIPSRRVGHRSRPRHRPVRRLVHLAIRLVRPSRGGGPGGAHRGAVAAARR